VVTQNLLSYISISFFSIRIIYKIKELYYTRYSWGCDKVGLGEWMDLLFEDAEEYRKRSSVSPPNPTATNNTIAGYKPYI